MNVSEQLCVQLVPLFKQLGLASQRKIEQLVEYHYVKRGELVFSPLMSQQMIMIKSGSIKIFQLSTDGQEQLLRVLSAGEYAGERWLFGQKNETLYAQARVDSEVCLIRYQNFNQLLLQYPSLSIQLLQLTIEKVNHLEQHRQILAISRVEARIAAYLMMLQQEQNQSDITMPYKLKELATYLGTTPETISRKLKLLERHQLVVRNHMHIKLLNIPALQEMYL